MGKKAEGGSHCARAQCANIFLSEASDERQTRDNKQTRARGWVCVCGRERERETTNWKRKTDSGKLVKFKLRKKRGGIWARLLAQTYA